MRLWCTACDKDMEFSGMALDDPADGEFYICPECATRVILFRENCECARGG